jgi:hypothetical protein
MRGTATERFLGANALTLDFGDVQAKREVEPKELTVTNLSSQPQTVDVMLGHPTGTPYSVSPSALMSIPAGGNATVTVSYRPTTASSTPDENEIQLWLRGAGAAEAETTVRLTGKAHGLGQNTGCACGNAGAGSVGLVSVMVLASLAALRRRRG